jgi:thiamine monophosphate synthase
MDPSALRLPPLLAISDRRLAAPEPWAGELQRHGVGWVQLREKDLAGRDLLRHALRCRRLARPGCLVTVNGRVDVCLAAGLDGVHLPSDANRALLRDLCGTMVDGSLCALGGMAPFPVLSVLDHFPEDLGPRQ